MPTTVDRSDKKRFTEMSRGWAIREIGGKRLDWPEARSTRVLFLDGGWTDWMRAEKKKPGRKKWFDFSV